MVQKFDIRSSLLNKDQEEWTHVIVQISSLDQAEGPSPKRFWGTKELEDQQTCADGLDMKKVLKPSDPPTPHTAIPKAGVMPHE